MVEKDTPTISGSLSDIVANVSDMLRLNLSMFRVEMSQKMARVVRAVAALAVAAVVLVFALSYAVFSLYLWIVSTGFSPQASSWIVSGVALALGGALLLYGIGAIMKLSPVPERTLGEFGKNISALKANLKRGAANDAR